MNKKRDAEFDIAKGILILCVVIGHGGSDSIADFVYRFHMPLFFILSGYFIQNQSDVGQYAKRQFEKLMIPYFLYMLIDYLFFDHLHNLNRVLHYLWGGRFINGVYWYTTCFFMASIIYVAMLKHFSSQKVVLLSIIGGGISIIESKYLFMIPLLKKPGILLNADVALLCLSYLAIGCYGRKFIDAWRKSTDVKIVYGTIGISLILLMEFLIFGGRTLDMKQAFYPNLLYAYFVPVGYGLVLLRVCHLISCKCKYLRKMLQILGQVTIPIMYLHEPLNRYFQFAQENILIYMLIGIGVPVLLAMIPSNISVMPQSR